MTARSPARPKPASGRPRTPSPALKALREAIKRQQEMRHPKPKKRVFETTRSDENEDAHRDMDGFDVDEELARLRLALKSKASSASMFALEAIANIDEHLTRGGPLPKAWADAGFFARMNELAKEAAPRPPHPKNERAKWVKIADASTGGARRLALAQAAAWSSPKVRASVARSTAKLRAASKTKKAPLAPTAPAALVAKAPKKPAAKKRR